MDKPPACSGPRLPVIFLPAFDPDSFKDVASAFTGASVAAFGQAWRKTTHPAFRSATARAGQRSGALWILAELEDADIFNPEARFNQPFYLSGDVFEVFLRPETQDAYSEFHVGPANQRFQLKIPSAKVFLDKCEEPEPWRNWVIAEPLFESWTWIEPQLERWFVLARIPFASISQATVQPGARWFYSFSRYDYTRGQPDPVHSSTSPHRELSFHRQQEWGELVF